MTLSQHLVTFVSHIFENHVFQSKIWSMDTFALMSSDVEFNFKYNGIVDKLKNEEHQIISNKTKKRTMIPYCQKEKNRKRKGFSRVFTSQKYFLQICLLKSSNTLNFVLYFKFQQNLY